VSYWAAVWVSTVTRDWLRSMDFYGTESRRTCFSQCGSRSGPNAGLRRADLAGAVVGDDGHDAGEGPSRVKVGSSA
jgi:hypothetical protein